MDPVDWSLICWAQLSPPQQFGPSWLLPNNFGRRLSELQPEGTRDRGRQIDKVACNNPLCNFTDTDKQCLNNFAIFHSEPCSNNWGLFSLLDRAWLPKAPTSMLRCALCHTAEKRELKVSRLFDELFFCQSWVQLTWVLIDCSVAVLHLEW